MQTGLLRELYAQCVRYRKPDLALIPNYPLHEDIRRATRVTKGPEKLDVKVPHQTVLSAMSLQTLLQLTKTIRHARVRFVLTKRKGHAFNGWHRSSAKCHLEAVAWTCVCELLPALLVFTRTTKVNGTGSNTQPTVGIPSTYL